MESNAQSLHPSEAHTVVVSDIDVRVKYTVSTWLFQLFLKVIDLSLCIIIVSALCCMSWNDDH